MTGSGALAAGWLLLLTTVACAAVGVLLGGLVDARFLGGLAGGVLGTVLTSLRGVLADTSAKSSNRKTLLGE